MRIALVILETPRLILQQFELEDCAPLQDVFGDEEVMFYGNGIHTSAWIETWILGQQASYEGLGYGNWAVVNEAGNLIGYCGLSYEGDVGGNPEVTLGYRLVRRYWGQGYAFEAISATIIYGFDVLGLKRLVATIDPNNAASVRVAVKAGMVYEKDVMYEGYTHPDRVYVLETSA